MLYTTLALQWRSAAVTSCLNNMTALLNPPPPPPGAHSVCHARTHMHVTLATTPSSSSTFRRASVIDPMCSADETCSNTCSCGVTSTRRRCEGEGGRGR